MAINFFGKNKMAINNEIEYQGKTLHLYEHHVQFSATYSLNSKNYDLLMIIYNNSSEEITTLDLLKNNTLESYNSIIFNQDEGFNTYDFPQLFTIDTIYTADNSIGCYSGNLTSISSITDTIKQIF